MYMPERREKPNWFEGLSVDHITIVTVNDVPVEDDSGGTVSVRFMVLPSPYKWPTFLFDKNQRGSCGQSIILLKECYRLTRLSEYDVSANDELSNPEASEEQSDVVLNKDGVSANDELSSPGAFEEQSDVVLDNQSIYPVSDVPGFAAKRLLLGNRVVFSGHPGVGKSVEINIVLFHLFRELVLEQTVLEQIFFRISMQLYRFYVADDVISVEMIDYVGDNLISLAQYMRSISPVAMVRHTVLVLEMEEEETDPAITKVPLIIALSSRDLRKALKTISKSGNWADVVIRPPHAPEALIALAVALYQVEGEQFLGLLGLSGAAAPQQPSRKPASSASPSSPMPSSSLKIVTAVVAPSISTGSLCCH
jgi:hypothetical protein